MLTASRKVINGWAMYDWANSVYNLVITTTFFPIYFTAVTKRHFGSEQVPFLGRHFINSTLYDYSLALAYLLIALLYPILTSIADTRGNKKSFMRFFCYMGAAGCCLLYFFDGSNLGFGIASFILASMGYTGSLVFYNAYLPEIAAPQDQDRVSAKGYTYGYIGSVLLQIIGFVLVLTLKDVPPEKPLFLAPRLTFLLVGLWWAGFAQITFSVLPKINRAALKKTNVFTDGFTEVRKVYGEIRRLPVLKRFLRGFFFYSMGVQTVMLAATLFGSKTLGLEETKLIVTIVLIQLVAIAGAVLMSRLSARYGNIRVLIGVVALWIFICFFAYLTANRAEPLHPFHEQIETLTRQKERLAALASSSPGSTPGPAAHSSPSPLPGNTPGNTPSPRPGASPENIPAPGNTPPPANSFPISPSSGNPGPGLSKEAAGKTTGEITAEIAKTDAEIARLQSILTPRQAPIEYAFYALALAVGLVMGGIQSLSRSTYSKLMPETKDTASYFSYFDLTEKIAIVIGMFSFGAIEDLTHSMKNSIVFLIVFFAIGGAWLLSALSKQDPHEPGPGSPPHKHPPPGPLSPQPLHPPDAPSSRTLSSTHPLRHP